MSTAVLSIFVIKMEYDNCTRNHKRAIYFLNLLQIT